MLRNSTIMEILFDYDYCKMKENNNNFWKELVSFVFHPERIIRFSLMYNYSISDVDEIYDGNLYL